MGAAALVRAGAMAAAGWVGEGAAALHRKAAGHASRVSRKPEAGKNKQVRRAGSVTATALQQHQQHCSPPHRFCHPAAHRRAGHGVCHCEARIGAHFGGGGGGGCLTYVETPEIQQRIMHERHFQEAPERQQALKQR